MYQQLAQQFLSYLLQSWEIIDRELELSTTELNKKHFVGEYFQSDSSLIQNNIKKKTLWHAELFSSLVSSNYNLFRELLKLDWLVALSSFGSGFVWRVATVCEVGDRKRREAVAVMMVSLHAK